MARLIDPRGVRYGVQYDWNVVGRDKNDLACGIYKDYFFINYIENLFIEKALLKKGILFDSVKINHRDDGVHVDVYLYDSQYEEIFTKFGVRSTDYYKYKLLSLERSLISSVLSYYGKEGHIVYYILDNKTLSGEGLARYIGIKLVQGFDLGEAVGDIVKSLNQRLKEKNPMLYGYRISCYGRFTRRQRTSYRTYKEGRLSLNMVSSYIDYGSKEVFLKYGACNIKVWLNKNYSIEKYRNKVKI